jgi:hypothetical protein
MINNKLPLKMLQVEFNKTLIYRTFNTQRVRYYTLPPKGRHDVIASSNPWYDWIFE